MIPWESVCAYFRKPGLTVWLINQISDSLGKCLCAYFGKSGLTVMLITQIGDSLEKKFCAYFGKFGLNYLNRLFLGKVSLRIF